MPPRKGRPGGLLLTPGAGSGREHHTLVAVEEALAPLPVRRVDFPYRKEGRRPPDRAPKLIASVRADAADFASSIHINPARLLLGGRSMGGRMCSMAVAEGLPARGLILISYPLHPPKKPERLRIEHLPALAVPCLFISGTRDAFGTPEELVARTAAVPGPVTHHWVEGGRHDLDRSDDEIVAAITAWIADLPVP